MAEEYRCGDVAHHGQPASHTTRQEIAVFVARIDEQLKYFGRYLIPRSSVVLPET